MKKSHSHLKSPGIYCREQYILVVNVKISLDCYKLEHFPCLIMPMSTKCQKMRKKMTINVIQHDGRL
jgi:hypothetical protein